jgi:hypothetical protein
MSSNHTFRSVSRAADHGRFVFLDLIIVIKLGWENKLQTVAYVCTVLWPFVVGSKYSLQQPSSGRPSVLFRALAVETKFYIHSKQGAKL